MPRTWRTNNFSNWTRPTGAVSPIASDRFTLNRLRNYRRSNLTASALFAVVLAEYPDVRQLGRTAAKPAAD